MSFVKRTKKKKNENHESITIVKIPYGISTITGIDCEAFERGWKSEKDTIYVKSQKLRNKIIKAIYSATPFPEAENQIDTRCKIYIKHINNKCDTICLGTTQIIIRDGKSLLCCVQQISATLTL